MFQTNWLVGREAVVVGIRTLAKKKQNKTKKKNKTKKRVISQGSARLSLPAMLHGYPHSQVPMWTQLGSGNKATYMGYLYYHKHEEGNGV